MTEYKLFTILMIMVSINVVLFLFQGAVSAENPGAQYTNLDDSTTDELVDGESVNTSFNWETIETGESATYKQSEFSSASSAMRQSGSSLWKIVSNIFTQPAGYMRESGVPDPIRIGFSVIWYALAVALIIGLIRGGSGD